MVLAAGSVAFLLAGLSVSWFGGLPPCTSAARHWLTDRGLQFLFGFFVVFYSMVAFWFAFAVFSGRSREATPTIIRTVEVLLPATAILASGFALTYLGMGVCPHAP